MRAIDSEVKPAAAGTRFSDTVSYRMEHGVLVVTIDNPPVNAASATMRAGLNCAIVHAGITEEVRAVVIIGSGRSFVGGADIREFGQPMAEPTLPQVVELIEASDKPVVAALNGVALGGGCEIALACHYRIASRAARIGLPEVKLGIIPGAGGTQRLPRLTGTLAAAEMIATGRIIDAEEAQSLGIVDKVTDGDLARQAIAAARRLVVTPPRRTGELAVAVGKGADVDALADKVLAKARGQIAPAEAIRLVRLAAEASLADGLAEERATFLMLRDSEQSKALRHVFFAERAAAKVPGIEHVEPRPVATIGVIGAGLMGSGIAVSALNAGYRVICIEQTAERATAGEKRISALLDRAVASGRLDADGRADRLSRLEVTANMNEVATADLVIEAVFDDLTVKTDLFRELGRLVRPDAILATNTSYLDPDAIAEAVPHPERVLGLHFFSPANIMRLVEVVRCDKTTLEVLATGLAVAKKLGKLPVVSGVCEGFIGNRIFSAYRREAEFLVEDGALPQEIDKAMEDFGMAMGPFAVFDLAGLEIAWARRKRQAATRDPAERYVEIADRLCEAGRFGQKSGKGWYVYPDGKRTVDPEVTSLIEGSRAAKGIQPRGIDAGEIVSRLLAAMAAEGDALLAEGIAQRASDIDLVMINGYGFPAHKGGPMFAAGRS
ncbi:MAG: enoyl-CoA hydratase/isomerase family protein [Alphaproteobacteria bacterium]|nr:enoyl-CoA hydratase/isomerase family protein [Alphaproteobacteria bacterium]MBU0803384.1 enoyl-CoA hydratase/isomerase family protein [Alphaproteobacteria bacterium]MBU0871920.1 enoyl-CoA hydratase/isomerase family protein [Alphaproteobacteria bacterium]MBU1402313.1 enoyl-CoA hydratase/isomerase family protein [Alphaproteobacteria bacterium]MBU1590958.1 enoyl-CoA hydratase/isomerase family protein [Alphaproteobacteria bacterium]